MNLGILIKYIISQKRKISRKFIPGAAAGASSVFLSAPKLNAIVLKGQKNNNTDQGAGKDN